MIVGKTWDLLTQPTQEKILAVLRRVHVGRSDNWILRKEITDRYWAGDGYWRNVNDILDTTRISDLDLTDPDHVAALAWHLFWHWGDGGCLNWTLKSARRRTGFTLTVTNYHTAWRAHVGFDMADRSAHGRPQCALRSRLHTTSKGQCEVWRAQLRCTAADEEKVRTVAQRLCEDLTLGRLGLVAAWRLTAITGVPEAVDATAPVLGGRKGNQTAAVGLIAGGAGLIAAGDEEDDPALLAVLEGLESGSESEDETDDESETEDMDMDGDESENGDMEG